MTDYVFTLSVRQDSLDEARRQWEELASDVHVCAPQAAFVVVTPAFGLSLIDKQHQCLDLTQFPFSLYERIVSFFGCGIYSLETARLQLKGYKL